MYLLQIICIIGIITYFEKNSYVFSDLSFTGIIGAVWPGHGPTCMEDIVKVKKELRWFAAVLVGIAAFVLWYIQSPGYYHNRVMSPTLASYYLQLEAVKDYRDPGKYIEKISVETLDKGKDTSNREITVTIRAQMNGRFDYLPKSEAEQVILSTGKDLRDLNRKAREEALLPAAIRKCKKGKIHVTDRLILLYTDAAGEHEFPET